jgi:hypothetical protein
MKYVKADLLDQVVSSYDQTKTTTQGRCFVKTVDGKQAVGPSLNKFLDVQTDSGITLASNNMYLTSNGRAFLVSTEAGVASVILYEIDYDTGVNTYIGRIQIQMPDTAATTTTYRALKVIDSGTTGWKLFLVTTGSVTINGGTLLVNNLARADFVPIGFPTIPFATGNDQKAVYFLQDPANLGVLHSNSNIASAGAVLDQPNNRLYVHNGVAATHQYYVFATNTAPTYTTSAITGTAATDVISHAGHSFLANDPIVFTSLTGGAGLVVGTVYFVRNPVAGVSYELSATSGGALLNFTTDISAGAVGRAFGTTGSNFVHKTGNLPALTGTLLLTDSEDYAVPQHTTNSGQPCAFFATSTNIYLGQLSELTSGAVAWPSLVTANLLGSSNQILTPTATQATWSNILDRAIVTTGLIFIMKQCVNNVIDRIFGGTSNKYLETFNYEPIELQPGGNLTAMDAENGWLAIANTVVGQRGVILSDLRSDSLFDHSFVVTKVLDTPDAVYKFITTIDSLYDFTGSLDVYYRTSGFGSVSGGWTSIPFAEDLSLFATAEQVQFKIAFATLGLDTSIPAQLCDFFLGYESLTDSSDNWELSVDDSDNGNPSRTAFRLKKLYSSSVPTLYYRAKDLSNVLLVNHDTITNAARFEYSTNDGITWSPVGTIPNTIGTLVRYTFSTPPGVDIRPSLRES